MFHCCNMKKLSLILKLKSSAAQRINLTFVPYSFVANFVSYMCAKNYLNWFSFHIVVMKVIGVNFFLKHSVYMMRMRLRICYSMKNLNIFWCTKIHILKTNCLLLNACWLHYYWIYVLKFNKLSFTTWSQQFERCKHVKTLKKCTIQYT